MNFTLRIRLYLSIFALLVMLPVVAAPVLNAQTGVNGNGRILAGYWHDWETPLWIPLRSVPSSYDIIVVAFATYNGSGNFSFTVDPAETQAQFISDINYLHTQGKKVLISLGGASETPTLGSSSDAQNFATSAASIVQQFGFDGIDIDFENGAVYLNENDTNINAPTTPSVVYLIDGLKQFHSTLPNAMVTMAPIANYLQAGYQYYGPGPYGDSNWNGAYIPVIQATSSFLSYVWPQYYNECNIEALDNNLYCEGTDGNLVAMSEMLMKGFPVAWNAGNFTPLPQNKVLMGVPASPSASPGYLSNSDLEASFNYLITGKDQVGTYTLINPAGYPNTAGFMTWSINWDVYSNSGALGTGIHAYLASLPPVQGNSPPPPPPASFSLSDAPGSLSVAQGAAGSSTFTVLSSNGFNSAVSLSISGLPAGVTASFSAGSVTPPANGSATSALTLTANGAATTGTATVTITAIGGGLTKTTTLSLTVTSIGGGTFNFEAASMSPVGTGATVSTSSDPNVTGGLLEFLNSTAAGQSMTLTTPSIPAGTYQVQFRFKTNTSRAQHTVAIDGTQIGGTIDQYATTSTYPTVTLGNVTFATTGTHTIVLTVTGKDAAATKFYVTADKFTFVSQGGEQQAAAPVFSPGGGNYTTGPSVMISSSTSGASIRYTTDGSTPTETVGTLYSGPVSISTSPTTLEAIAYAAGFTGSPVTSATYTIGGPPPTFNFEAASMSPVGTGATVSTSSDPNVTGGLLEFLNSTAVGQSMTLTTPSMPAGTYQVQFRYKTNTSRAQHNVVIDGTQIGGTIDQYATTSTYATATLGNVTFAATGSHTLVLTVTGKDAAATHFYISADKFTFVGQ